MPAVRRDLALVIAVDVPVERVLEVLREVQRLSQDEGVNLAGIKRIIELVILRVIIPLLPFYITSASFCAIHAPQWARPKDSRPRLTLQAKLPRAFASWVPSAHNP